MATIGQVEGRGALGRPPVAMALLPTGELALVDPLDGDRIRVYSADGRLSRSFGRSGSGPGEFRNIALLIAGERYLHVFDRGNGRHSRLTYGGDYVDGSRAYSFFDGVQLEGKGIVLNADVNTSERIGYPLHLIDPEGNLVHSFGSELPVFRVDLPWLRMRALASGSSAVWSGQRTRYRIEKWSPEGQLLSAIVRDTDWFDPYEEWAPINSSTPPRPWLQSIAVGSTGRLWTATHVAGDDWQRALGPPAAGLHGESAAVEDLWLWDTVVEVLDTQKAVLVASVRLPDKALAFLGPGHLVTARLTSEGVPLIDVWKIEVHTQ